MKVNFDIELKDLDGDRVVEGGKPIRVRDLITSALLQSEQGDEAEQKIKKWDLANKIHQGGDVDILPEDAALIKKLVGERYAPLVVGQVFPILNG